MLDIAPATPLMQFMQKDQNISYRSADLYMQGVTDRVDVTDMSTYPDGSFDFFICSHVLEHVDNDSKAIQELARVLAPSGEGIVMVPIVLSLSKTHYDPKITLEADRWKYFGQGDHVRAYSKVGFKAELNKAFFVHEYGVDEMGAEVFKRHGISLNSVLYVVTKR
jgi:SAM-dependent methyltransferase